MENEALVPNPHSQQGKIKRDEDVPIWFPIVFWSLVCAVIFAFFFSYIRFVTLSDAENREREQADRERKEEEEEKREREVTIPSMDFTVLNMTETRLSVKWDLLIRIPPVLPGFYVCLEGDFKVSIAYKGVTIAATPIESYTLEPYWSKLLKVSLIASEGNGAIMKNIVEDVKARGEVRFGSGLLFPDCRKGTSGTMNYACDEATLRFKPGSQTDATLVENQPKCLSPP
ncbi:F204 protein [Hirschfeldia incana]|nr:F204 protein [Hirschfeldia incana]